MPEQPVYVENELFLGRLDEQDHFRDVLRQLLTGQGDDAPPFIFLIHGVSGIGKSQLTRRLRDIARCEPPFEDALHVLCVDWEEVRFHTPALQVAHEQIHPEDVLGALHRAALDQGWGRHFRDYQKTVQQRDEAERQVARAVEQLSGESPYAAIRDLGATGLARLVRQALPAIGQTGEDLARALLAAGIQVGAEGAAHLRQQAEGFLHARLKPELYKVYRQPHEQLARALGRGLASVSRDKPLVLPLDTYEIVAEAADACLRQVIRSAGPRVTWVIAGRHNLAPSRSANRYVGYSTEFPRRLAVWDMAELAVNYVWDYLRERAPGREASREDAVEIHLATLGVPLALRLAADLWADGVPRMAITHGVPDHAPRETIVRRMCERVLLHVEPGTAGAADRRALYLLAMQPRPDGEVQAAVLRPAEGDFDLGARLAELARRYSAVRLEGGARLHDAMGAFVREDLLTTEARHGDDVAVIATRAVEALRARRAVLEADLPTLAERVASEDWRQATLDLTHWLFWHDQGAAWHELVPRLVEGLGYSLVLAWGLLEIAKVFGPALSRDGQKRLKRLQAGMHASLLVEMMRLIGESGEDDEERGTMLDDLETLQQRGWLENGNAAFTVERRAILLLWRGRWYTERDRHEQAFSTLLQAEDILPTQAYALAEQFGRAFYNLGVALHDLGRHQETIEAYQKAIELDPKRAYPLNGLGSVFRVLGRYQEAIGAYQKAIRLDPEYAHPWNGLGIAFHALGRHQEAIKAYKRAIDLDPKEAAPYHNLGKIYLKLGQIEEARLRFETCVRLLPDGVPLTEAYLGVINHHQGETQIARRHFERALEIWDTGGARSRYTPAMSLKSKALALLGLGRPQEASAALQQALEQRLPDDQIDFFVYDLLAAAPQPPEGLEDIVAMLKEANGE